jgi:hypothetical protein
MECSWISGKQNTIKVQLGGNRKLREKTTKSALYEGYIFELVPNIAHRLWIWCTLFFFFFFEVLCTLNWWIEKKCLYCLLIHRHLINKWESWQTQTQTQPPPPHPHTHTHPPTHTTFILPSDSPVSPQSQFDFVRIHRVIWHCVFITNITFKSFFSFSL